MISLKRLIFISLLSTPSVSSAGSSSPEPTFNPDYKVDILFVFDRGVSVNDKNNFINTHISDLNSVLKDSRANLKAYSAGYIDSPRKIKNILDLNNDKFIRTHKKNKKADLVYLFGDLDLKSNVCGIAGLRSSYGAGRVSHTGCTSTHTFNHEFGHMIGLAHSKNNSPSPVYAAGHGNWAWVTIMGYPGTHGGLIIKRNFSNPNIKCDALYSCGDAKTADAVRYINEVAPKRFKKNVK